MTKKTILLFLLSYLVAFPSCSLYSETEMYFNAIFRKDVSYVIENTKPGSLDANTRDQENFTALMWAVDIGTKELVDYYLSLENTDVNLQEENHGYSALMVAVKVGNLASTKALLAKGANMSFKDKEGNTALLLAVQFDKKFVAEYLIKQGAELDIQDKIGRTLLIIAAKEGQTKVVKYLLEKGADINAKDEFDRDALYFARENEHLEIYKLLKKNMGK